MNLKLKKGMLIVLFANILNLGFSLISNFMLPKCLSVDTYSAIKSYQLFCTYIGLLHFGYVDGMYLRYGGKDQNEIDSKILGKNLSTFRVFQFIIATIGITLSCLKNDIVLLAAALSIYSLNIGAYCKMFFQATGEFNKYSRLMNLTTILPFAGNMFFLFCIKTDAVISYLGVYVIVNIFISLAGEILLYKRYHLKIFYFSIKELVCNVKSGILLTLGNLSSTFLTGMDRWFVKFLLDTSAFAQYSFAVSMENFINVIITPITVTLYNYFCKVDDVLTIRKARNYVIIASSVIVAAAFPAKFVMEIFLKNYMDSSVVMIFLFGAQIFYIVIKGVYVNLYKARGEQKKYFSELVGIIAIGFGLNIICFLVFRQKEAFAVATLLSALIWYCICVVDFKDLPMNKKEFLFPIVVEIIYICAGIMFQSLSGLLIYVIGVVITIKFLLPDELCAVIHMLRSRIQKVVH